ncbi:MAG: FtsX-like permease family protein [Planctomycetes bacterium]|nr:FtsX-like permease family protein [Planctomycetota bacterium]
MDYALSTLWYERQRYLPAVLAVAFSCLLIALQCGLLLGLFSITSIPIDESRADIWVGHPDVPSVDLGIPIPEAWQSYLAMPEVERTEPYMEGFAYWKKPTGGMELVLVIGARLGPDSIGAIRQLTTEHRTALSEPNSVVVDEGEFGRLGITKVGDTAEILGKRVRVVGTVTGLRSLAGPYLFCSLDTARSVLRPPSDQCTFILAKCHNKADAAKVVERLKAFPKKLAPFTTEDFSAHSQLHWLFKTKAGVALGLAALLGLMVGAVVTSTTLHSATSASLKEYAVLRALGIPRWRMMMMVVSQSFWVGIAGIVVALPIIFGLAYLGEYIGAKILLRYWLLIGACLITMTMAMLSGLVALRSLQSVEPVTLLR